MAKVTALNTVSGRVAEVPASYLTHPVLGKTLVEVPEGTKNYDPRFYKPTDAEGHQKKQARKSKEEVDPGPAIFDFDAPIEPTQESENL